MRFGGKKLWAVQIFVIDQGRQVSFLVEDAQDHRVIVGRFNGFIKDDVFFIIHREHSARK